jgi:hypothetical protein
MSGSNAHSDEFQELLIGLIDGVLTSRQRGRLGEILRDDPAARHDYLLQMAIHGRLCKRHPACSVSGDRIEIEDAALDSGASGSQSASQCKPPPAASACPGFFGSAWHSASGCVMSHELLLGYVVAAVLFGVAALIGVNVQVSEQGARKVAIRAPTRAVPNVAHQPEVVSVARVTSQVDCTWADASQAPSMQRILLGDKFALASGLMEITYDTGAKVVLQGPCTYTVESRSGGYLERGRLTARVESAVGSRQSAVSNTTPTYRTSSSNSLPTADCRLPTLFSVRTPTAVVTDLGTEFGVEVDPQGATQSHVFRGTVKVCVVDAAGNPLGQEQTLGANESARVAVGGDAKSVTVTRVDAAAAEIFAGSLVRRMPKLETKILDLADIVAGGDGLGKARDRGINPGNGQVVDVFAEGPFTDSDGRRYHPVPKRSYIDGVFVPKAGIPVQLDSSGHMFNELGNTDSRCPRYIWAGSIPDPDKPLLNTVFQGVDYSDPKYGVFYLCADVGITFDLEAIRRAHSNAKIVAFDAFVGRAAIIGSSDVLVFVDGQEHVRWRASKQDRSRLIHVTLYDRDRFLTLVSGDGGNGVTADWHIWCNPRLTLKGYGLTLGAGVKKEQSRKGPLDAIHPDQDQTTRQASPPNP